MAPLLNNQAFDAHLAHGKSLDMMTKKTALAKRVLDIVISILLVPIAVVLCLIFGALFYIVNKENPVFMQKRVGRFREVFTLVKLRTMSSATLDKPTHEISSSDISKLGQIMRAIKVDELPQLYNVLRGEMSLVGPRPCMPSQIELIEARHRLGVYDAMPGITGYAQVRGIDMSVPEVLAAADQVYLKEHSLMGDFGLLFQTLVGRGSGDKTS